MSEEQIREQIRRQLLCEIENRSTVLLIQSKIDDLCLAIFERAYKQASNDVVKIVNQGRQSITSSD